MLRYRILYLYHFPTFAGHPEGRKKYDSRRRLYYWTIMANWCIHDRFILSGMRQNHENTIQAPEATPSVSSQIAIIINRHANTETFEPNTSRQSNFLSHYVPVCKDHLRDPNGQDYILSRRFAFLDNRICLYGMPTHLLTENGPQLVPKFFTSVFAFIGTHNSTTTTHWQWSSQVEKYNKTLMTGLLHYVEACDLRVTRLMSAGLHHFCNMFDKAWKCRFVVHFEQSILLRATNCVSFFHDTKKALLKQWFLQT